VSTRFAIIAVVVVCGAIGVLEAALLLRDPNNTQSWVARADRPKEQMVDHLDMIDSAGTFKAGQMRHLRLVDHSDGPVRVALDSKPQKGYPREGTWTSPQTQTLFNFTELIPSWNVVTPPETGVHFEVRVREARTGQWSPWLRIGAWGRIAQSSRVDSCEFASVDTDTLWLDQPADCYQFRATLQSFVFDAKVKPAVRRIAISYSGPVNSNSIYAKAADPDPGPVEKWARSLNVPFHAQGDNARPVTGMTCSPTSVTMVLDYWGATRPIMENVLAIWDDHNALFGNWSNNTQRASELGMDAWIQHFRNWDQVKAMIAKGQPVVASIQFEKGTVPDSPTIQATEGHLIVIRGFTGDGRVIVNDPARKKNGEGALFPMAGLAHAWFGTKGGVGYVIRPPAKPLPQWMVKGSMRDAGPTTNPAAAVSSASR
jgi:hypothetical protein